MSGLMPFFRLAILILAYVFAFLDRQILSLLVGPVKHDLGLTDTQISLLQGLSFALLLALVGLPIGRLVDTRRRTAIIAVGMALWSLATALCGLTRSFSGLLLCRAGVGVGEACLTPSAYSLLADWFPARHRGIAFGLYGTGVYMGLGLSYVIAGGVVGQLGTEQELILPIVGTIHPWQAVFLAVGLPGLLVALCVAALREPQRTGQGATMVPVSEVTRYFRTHWRPILLVDLAGAFAAMAAYSLSAWVPSLFIRAHGWPASAVGLRFGLMVMAAGIAGYAMSGWFGDKLVERLGCRGRIDIIGWATLTAAPLVCLAPLLADPWQVLGCYGLGTVLITAAVGSGPAAQLTLVPAPMRGMAIALAFLVVNLVGLGLGPSLVALLTDHVIGDEAKLGQALAIASPLMLLICTLLARAAVKSYPATADGAEKWAPSC